MRISFPEKPVYIVAVICSIIFINILVHILDINIDFTTEKRLSLNDRTLLILRDLNKPLNIYFFSSASPTLKPIDDFLKGFENRSKFINYRKINPNIEKRYVKKYDLYSFMFKNERLYATIVIESGTLRKYINIFKYEYEEQKNSIKEKITIKNDLEIDITKNLLKMTKRRRKIYFTLGHGEGNLSNNNDLGYSKLKNRLESENFIISDIYIAQRPRVPWEISALIILDPKKNFSKEEFNFLEQYLKIGGRIFVLINPCSEFNPNDFFSSWGIRTKNNLIVDKGSSYYNNPLSPLVSRYENHIITSKLQNNFTLFEKVLEVNTVPTATKPVNTTRLIKTSGLSWRKNSCSPKILRYNPATDRKGPISIMAVTEALNPIIKKRPVPRIAVIGDSDFVINKYLEHYYNFDLFLNTLNWLVGYSELQNIKGRTFVTSNLKISTRGLNFIFLISILIVPVLILSTGLWIWYRKRD